MIKNIIIGFIFFLFLGSSEVYAGFSVIGELTRERAVQCGEKFEEKILLKNKGDVPTKVKIYQTDYLFFADGKNIYGEPGSIPRSNGKWITIDTTRLVIPPKNTASFGYMVRLPQKKDLKGTYWSIIMVELIPSITPEKEKDKKRKGEFGIETRIRYGIQIVTHIMDTGTRNIKFLDKKLIYEKGKKIFQLDIENTGERLLVPFVWAEFYNKNGINIGRFESKKLRIYPECSVRHSIDLTAVQKGKYKVLVIVDNEDGCVFGARYNLRIK
ncbi:hypothetical protein KAU39_05050 [bacterium]|nr:hypothetical protein [bacterium]